MSIEIGTGGKVLHGSQVGREGIIHAIHGPDLLVEFISGDKCYLSKHQVTLKEEEKEECNERVQNVTDW